MRKLLILADDLSGAADCANACTSSGLNAVVSFEDLDEDVNGEVLSIDCDTRHLSPAEAAARVTRIMRSPLLRQPDQLVFKKVDSTLRGNVGSELRATLNERRAASSNRIVAVMAPAFPAGGRTTVDGYQLLRGVPLDETEIWRHNGLSGVAHLPTMLRQAGISTSLLPLSRVRGNLASLRSSMLQLATEIDVIICDVETDDDLSAIAHASFVLGRETIWAGSAGLAYQFPHAAGLTPSAPPIEQPEFSLGPILFVVGSMSSVSHRQARALEDGTPVTPIHILPSVLLDGPSQPAWNAVADRIHASLHSGNDTLVILDANEWVDLQERRRLTDALGLMLAPHAPLVGALVATGGETARAILDSWGIASLFMLSELERGLPFSFARIDGRPLPLLTKAGAFGSQETLVSCWRFFTSLLREQDYATVRKLL
jgi:4-hydroxythreonine-4-phosphate dehydrogenase